MAFHSAQDLQKIYENRFRANTEYRDRVWRILCGEFFQKWVTQKDTVLDLGSGYCQFINHINVANKYAMDLNPTTVERASANVSVIQRDCCERWPLPDASIDLVFSSNFFEHLPSKPDLERTLQQAFRCLKPGGRLIAMGPNVRLVPGAYWDFFDHHIPLTEKSMAEVLEKIGFRTLTGVAAFLPFTMVEVREYPIIFLRLYLRLKAVWRLFGKQFLVVVEKPSSDEAKS